MFNGRVTARVADETFDGAPTDVLQVMWVQESVEVLGIDKVPVTAACLSRKNTTWTS